MSREWRRLSLVEATVAYRDIQSGSTSLSTAARLRGTTVVLLEREIKRNLGAHILIRRGVQRKLTDEQEQDAVTRHDAGESYMQIAISMCVSTNHLRTMVNKWEMKRGF